jgi:hypothetical protein
MIARIGHGATPAAESNEYLNLTGTAAIPDYRSTPGNQGDCALRRGAGGTALSTEPITIQQEAGPWPTGIPFDHSPPKGDSGEWCRASQPLRSKQRYCALSIPGSNHKFVGISNSRTVRCITYRRVVRC